MRKRIISGIIVLMMIVSLAACSVDEKQSSSENKKEAIVQTKRHLTAVESNQLIQKNLLNPDFIIVDIRTPREYKSSRIAKSINIDFYDRNFSSNLAKLDNTKSYIFYCRSGNRTGQAEKIIRTLGLKQYYILSRGINDWYSNKFELIN